MIKIISIEYTVLDRYLVVAFLGTNYLVLTVLSRKEPYAGDSGQEVMHLISSKYFVTGRF